MLDNCPLLTVEYCRCVYKTKLSHWKNLLEELLKRIDTISSEMVKQSDTILNVYQGTGHLLICLFIHPFTHLSIHFNSHLSIHH